MKGPMLLHAERRWSARQTPHGNRVRTGLNACTRCCSRRCAGGHHVVNQNNSAAGDRRVGDESILCIGEPAFFVQSMLGRAVVTISQPGSYGNGL